MVKIYAVSVSMVLTMIISIFLFGLVPTPQLFYGITIIAISMLLYFELIDASISQPVVAPVVLPIQKEFSDDNDEEANA
jgi:hypothetical protein